MTIDKNVHKSQMSEIYVGGNCGQYGEWGLSPLAPSRTAGPVVHDEARFSDAPQISRNQFPKILLAFGEGMWHTISVLPVKRRDNRLPARAGGVEK